MKSWSVAIVFLSLSCAPSDGGLPSSQVVRESTTIPWSAPTTERYRHGRRVANRYLVSGQDLNDIVLVAVDVDSGDTQTSTLVENAKTVATAIHSGGAVAVLFRVEVGTRLRDGRELRPRLGQLALAQFDPTLSSIEVFQFFGSAWLAKLVYSGDSLYMILDAELVELEGVNYGSSVLCARFDATGPVWIERVGDYDYYMSLQLVEVNGQVFAGIRTDDAPTDLVVEGQPFTVDVGILFQLSANGTRTLTGSPPYYGRLLPSEPLLYVASYLTASATITAYDSNFTPIQTHELFDTCAVLPFPWDVIDLGDRLIVGGNLFVGPDVAWIVELDKSTASVTRQLVFGSKLGLRVVGFELHDLGDDSLLAEGWERSDSLGGNAFVMRVDHFGSAGFDAFPCGQAAAPPLGNWK